MRKKDHEEKTDGRPIILFGGNPWEAGLLRSMLEDAGIEVFLRDEALGTLAPWYAGPGGTSAVKVVISDADLDRARPVLAQFEKNRTEPS